MNYDQLKKEHPDWGYRKIKYEVERRRTHRFSDTWFLDLTDKTWLRSFNLLQNHIVIETVVEKDNDYKTIETYVDVDLY